MTPSDVKSLNGSMRKISRVTKERFRAKIQQNEAPTLAPMKVSSNLLTALEQGEQGQIARQIDFL